LEIFSNIVKVICRQFEDWLNLERLEKFYQIPICGVFGKKMPPKSGGKKVPQIVIKIAKILHTGNTLNIWKKA